MAVWRGLPRDFQGGKQPASDGPAKREPGHEYLCPQFPHHPCPSVPPEDKGTSRLGARCVAESAHNLDSSGHRSPNQSGGPTSFSCKIRAITVCDLQRALPARGRFTAMTRRMAITPAAAAGSHRGWASSRSPRRSGSAALGSASFLWRSPPASLTGNFEPRLRLAERLPQG